MAVKTKGAVDVIAQSRVVMPRMPQNGTAVVAVLVLRALGEWHELQDRG